MSEMASGKVLFCDMDGTLARFYEPEECLRRYLTEPDYFEKLRPYENLVKAISKIMQDGVPVVILSAVDGSIRTSSEMQKNKWLKDVFSQYGEVPPALYPSTGENKSEYVKSIYGDNEKAYLLDDYSKNLMDWDSAGGKPIKALNEINGSGGKFTGPRINIDTATVDEIYQSLKSILNEK